MPFNLYFASLAVRKAAAIRGITRGMFRPVRTGLEITDQVVVTSRDNERVTLTKDALEYAGQFTWKEIKEQF